MSDAVWVSFAINSQEAIGPFTAAHPDTPGYDRSQVPKDYQSGKPVDPAFLPKAAVQDDNWRHFQKFPPLFQVNEYMCVTEKLTQFLRQFDLGSAGMYPIKLETHGALAADPAGPFCILGLSTQKKALVPELSKKLDSLFGTYLMPVLGEDDQLALNRSALTGPDLWTDPAIKPMFFVSQRLRDALERVGFAKAFKLYRCKIVE